MKWSSVERQQVGIAVGLAANVDQGLALVIALEEILARHRRDQETERILVPPRRGLSPTALSFDLPADAFPMP